jgi:hypothetical protein
METTPVEVPAAVLFWSLHRPAVEDDVIGLTVVKNHEHRSRKVPGICASVYHSVVDTTPESGHTRVHFGLPSTRRA